MEREALIIFIKNPVLGKAKTRIAKDVGDEKALEIYLALLEHTRQVTSNWHGTRFLYYSDYIEPQDNWPNELYEKRIQSDGDLGQKMFKAFQEISVDYDSVSIIGSDCYQLRLHHLEEAFSKLKTNDAVIGPSSDGGYYLLGLNQVSANLFEGVEWSTSSVSSQTVNKILQEGMSFAQLETLTDIDHYSDWLDQI